jgi:hypothetical protein
LFPIDYLDEVLKEKITLNCFGKSDKTVCSNIVFPSISRPLEFPWKDLQARGLEIRQFRTTPSLCCYTHNKIAILQRNQDELPLFITQVERPQSGKPFTTGDQMLLMLITSIL